MDGIQKTVALGLRNLARKVEEGRYGEGDDAFGAGADDDYHPDAAAFLDDIREEVLDVME